MLYTTSVMVVVCHLVHDEYSGVVCHVVHDEYCGRVSCCTRRV